MVIIFLSVLGGNWALCWAAKNFFSETLKALTALVVYIEAYVIMVGGTEFVDRFFSKKDENND